MHSLRPPAGLRAVLTLLSLIVAVFIGLRLAEPVSSQKILPATKAKPGNRSVPGQNEPSFGSPTASTAIAFAVSMPVRYIAVAGVHQKPADLDNLSTTRSKRLSDDVKPQDLEYIRRSGLVETAAGDKDLQVEGELEINKVNREPGRVIDMLAPRSKDGALSTDSKFKAASPNVLPTPSVSFEGISFDDTHTLGQGYLPPDTNGEAGPNHFVQAVNATFRVWDKSGVPLIPVTKLSSLFASLSGPCATSNDGDPVVIYDQLADRWLISELCTNNVFPHHELIAISKTGDPTGAYFLYDFAMPNSKFNDYPKFGMWPDGYYMTDNQFDRTGNFFRGLGFFAFERSKMLAGDATASYVYFDSCKDNLNCKVFGGLPSDLDGFIPPPPGTPNTFAYFTADEYGDPAGDGIRFFDFHVDYTNPIDSTVIERIGSPLPVGIFDPRAFWNAEPVTVSSYFLDPISDRLMFRLAYRNFGNGRETLLMTHTVDVWQPDHSGIRYYELDRSSPAGPFVIAEQQTFSPDLTNRWMASGAMNFQGDTVVGFSTSSSTVYPSISYAAKLSTDPPGSGLIQGEQTVMAGTGSQWSSSRRWGDYSDVTVDPTDDCSFWLTHEYYQNTGTAPWHTRIAKVSPGPCAVAPRGTIQGSVTVCSTGVPLAGVSVEATGGFERITVGQGNYSMMVMPGTYMLSPWKLGYRTAAVGGITVINGGTAVQNFCMTPVTELNAPAPVVSTGNLVIEPNECNVLNIPITNNGAAAATAVTATLSSVTPGVTITSATSAYPDIASGGGVQSNTSPFQVRTDDTVACFSSIDMKLTLIFSGGGSPTTFSFSLPVGQAKGPNYAFTATNGATIPNTGTYVPGSSDFGQLFSTVPAPFAFTLYGRAVAAGEPIQVHQSGVIEFKTNFPNPLSINYRLPTSVFESPTAVLIPYWGDLAMRNDVITGSGIFTETKGSAPNRTFMVEWRGQQYPGHLGGPIDTDVAVFLHENSDNFEYVYGLTSSGLAANGMRSTVGVQGLNYGTNFTQYSYNSGVIGNGMKLSAARPPAVCVHGTGECTAATSRKLFDFDGDGKADISIFRPNSPAGAEWWYQRSSDGQVPAAQFGASTDIPVPADYTADGKTDIAFFRPTTGEWFVLRSEDQTYYALPYGTNGDIPLVGDYDGDHQADIIVYRPSTHYWFIRRSTNGATVLIAFGQDGDQPLTFDFDGDGKSDIALWRPNGATGGEWWGLKSTTGGLFAASFGSAGDKAVPADYTGDGKADIALWRPSTGQWFILRSEDYSYYAFPFGANGDLPVPADYDGDGKTDAAVFRPTGSTWYINRSTAGLQIQQFGTAGDVPVPNVFVR